MEQNDYQYEAASIDGFVSQLLRYVTAGYHFYFRGVVPDDKDPRIVVERVMKSYGVYGKKWRRERRNLKDNAGAHVLLFRRTFVVMLTKGRHDAFYQDHGFKTVKDKRGRKRRDKVPVPDIRRTALKVFGYSIRHDHRKGKTNVRLDTESRRSITAHMLTVAQWDCFRNPERMEREFRRKVRHQAYAPVYQELKKIVAKVNKARGKRGFPPIDIEKSVRKFQRIRRVFIEEEQVNSEEGEGRDQDASATIRAAEA